MIISTLFIAWRPKANHGPNDLFRSREISHVATVLLRARFPMFRKTVTGGPTTAVDHRLRRDDKEGKHTELPRCRHAGRVICQLPRLARAQVGLGLIQVLETADEDRGGRGKRLKTRRVEEGGGHGSEGETSLRARGGLGLSVRGGDNGD